MTRDIKDIITDMREIVKPYVAQMLFNENFEGKGNTDKAEFETEFEMLLTLAERGASVEPQEWISVKDRLPEEHQGCLFWDEILELGCGSYFTTSRGFGCFWDDARGSDAKNVIAWMPLPSPYKGE